MSEIGVIEDPDCGFGCGVYDMLKCPSDHNHSNIIAPDQSLSDDGCLSRKTARMSDESNDDVVYETMAALLAGHQPTLSGRNQDTIVFLARQA